MGFTRRDFLKLGIGSIAATSALDLKFLTYAEKKAEENKDYAVRSTCSANCTGACGMMAHVTQGRINTLIQAADYPEAEYNPRGCLKGLSMMNLIYGKDRLKTPLIRTGPRGSGEFRKASWDEALNYTAENLNKIASKYGTEAIGVTVQVPGTGYVNKGALVRLAGFANWSIHHGYDQNGDLPMFWPMTFGVQSEELETLEWLNAKYTMVFGSNVLQTRIPDAQLFVKAKQRGKIVVFDPDYCATAAKADEWVPLKIDTDTAMALGISKVIIDQELYDKKFLQDNTDLPILVRKDNGKKLLATEVAALAGRASGLKIPDYRALYVIHTPAGFTILNPESLKPTNADLEGEFQVRLTDGKTVTVTTVFSELKASLQDYTLDKVAKITEVPAAQIEKIAQEAGTIKPLHIIFGASNYQWYHSDLKGRAISLISVLTGNIGKSGAGISTLAGQYRIRFAVKDWWTPEKTKLKWVPYLYFLNGKGKGYPEKGIKAMVSGWGNPFDQHNMANALKNRASSGDIEFVVSTDFQMTTTCQWADVILPASSWYEKYDLTATPIHPYLQLQQPAIKPLFESKSELWIFRELAKRLNPEFEQHFFPELAENEAILKVTELLLEKGGPEVKGITLDMLKKGPVRLNSPAPDNRQVPFYEQIHDQKPFPPKSYPAKIEKTAQFVKSGRIEFYKDEDMFLALKEQLPVHKETFLETEYKTDPEAKSKYKLHYVTKNSIYRVHSTHSNNVWLNELQDYKPKAFLNAEDALERHIKAGDLVEIYNKRGKTRAYAVIDKGCRKGTVAFEQGWWSKYLQNESYNSLTFPWIKPTHEVYFVPGMWSPSTCWNECLVDVRRV